MATIVSRWRAIVWCGPAVALFAVLVSGRPARSADDVKEAPRKAAVHVYPEKLTAKDVLVDGPNGKRIEITAQTTLVWVDLHPDARYAHDTEYVLITARGSHVVKGQWWPVLNGKEILRGEKETRVAFPIELGAGG